MILKYIAEAGCEPVYSSAGAAGLDLRAAESLVVYGRHKVRTGLTVELPPGHVGLVRGRSGLAFNRGIFAFEGTIDADYRGEISVLLVNYGFPARVNRGDRIAQLVITPIVRCDLRAVQLLDASDRGAGGFGSTGT